MKTKVLLFVLIVFGGCIQYGNAQEKLQNHGQDQFDIKPDDPFIAQNEKDSSAKSEVNVFIPQNSILNNDSAFYAKIVKKHGWWIGVGKGLTKEEASHLSYYFKFSKKNIAGNWTFLEAFDGYGNATTYHNIGTYLVNQYDDDDKGANSDWKERLLTVCKWEFVADASGKVVIQERALNKDSAVVYIYTPVKVGRNEYTGSYTDGWGMPIFMRTDSVGNDAGYANFVHIFRDDKGFEVLYSFTDRFGYPQKNKDGAYMTRKEYDDMGNQTKEASQNIVGDNMIDDFGNCGWESTYDKIGRHLTSRYFNAKWEPIRMPNLRGGSGNVYGYQFEYDKYGRDTAIIVIDSIGNPDVNEFGVHKIIKRYNDYGRLTYLAYYDSTGNLIAGDKQGIVETKWEFNTKGDLLLVEYKDAQGQYVNGDAGFCKGIYEYDEHFIIKSEKDSMMNPQKELVCRFEYSRDSLGNEIRKWPLESRMRVDSVDTKGRSILMAWYDIEGNPIEYEGLHKYITKYDDNRNIETETWLNKDGNPFVDDERGYSKRIAIRNDSTHTVTIQGYFYDDLKYALQQKIDPETTRPTCQYDITSYGGQARVGWYNNLHYACNVDYTMYGEIRTMVGRNEFDEPAYLTFLGSSGEVYHFSDINNGDRRYYDEFGIEISDMEAFKEGLPRVYCIEITDTLSEAYFRGLRNGDIILSFGEWSTSPDLISDVEYFYLEEIIRSEKPKNVTLLRHHPKTKSSEIITCTLPAGRVSDLGFYPHKIYYTQKEKARLLNTCDQYNLTLKPYRMQKTVPILLAVQTKGGFEETRLYHLPLYNVKDPGVVLYAKERYDKGVDTWSILNTTEQWEKQNMFLVKGANLYITQDLSTARHIHKLSWGLGGMKFIPIEVDTATYLPLLRCYLSLGDSIIGEIDINEKQLLGVWKTVVTNDDYSIPITLEFLKDGKVNFRAECEMYDENWQVQLVITSSGGTWRLRNGCITFDFEDAIHDCNITRFRMYGADKKQERAAKASMHEYIEDEKEQIFEIFRFSEIFGSDVFFITQASSKEFEINVGESEITFTKQ